MGFINNELSIIGMPPLKNKVIDTVSLARKTLNSRMANLDYLCRRFSIDLAERKLHGALLDSQLLAEVYLELNGGKQISMNLQNERAEETKTIKTQKNNHNSILKITPSEEEILEHKTLVKKLKILYGKK